MSSALVTASLIGLAGLVYATLLGYGIASAADVLNHTTVGTFFTLTVLLSHSMTLFYVIGRGKAVREAVTDGNLSPELTATTAAARKPVLLAAPIAILLTMGAAIAGAGVDTGMLPAGAHALFALAAIVGNMLALRREIAAMTATTRVVDEVNALLAGDSPPRATDGR